MPAELMKCEACAELLDVEDVFCPNCGREAPMRAEEKNTPASSDVHSFECRQCGATTAFDAAAQGLKCAFCGSVSIEALGQGKWSLPPSGLLPFKIDAGHAQGAFRTWLGQGFWRPGDLASMSSVNQIRQLFLPVWCFSGDTHTYWCADSNRTPPGARADWCPKSGEHSGAYEGLLVPATASLSDGELEAIGDFSFAELQPYAPAAVKEIAVEPPSVSRKRARRSAQKTFEALEASACERLVPGSARNVHVNVMVTKTVSTLILAPIWIFAYTYKGKVFRFVMNGQTGQSTGQAPTSGTKVAIAIAIVIAVIAIILALAAQ
ncbi:MAG: hypothetical protein HYY93_03770 [Planctomycetes bacterium]|nr:hypothetical protein [Planctomycetota bacterium]